MNEDKRAAAAVLANLSGFLISAALAMLAIEGALFAFVLGSRDAGSGYYIASAIAFIVFILSIVCGGWGTTNTAESLAAANWTPSVGGIWFSCQALLSFLGLLAFATSALMSGSPKENNVAQTINKLSERIAILESATSQSPIAEKLLDVAAKDISTSLVSVGKSVTESVSKQNEILRELLVIQRAIPQKIQTRPRYLRLLDPPMSGSDIVRLQFQLYRLGFLVDEESTGCFDSKTADAVSRYQKSRQLKEDGVVGPSTRAQLTLDLK